MRSKIITLLLLSGLSSFALSNPWEGFCQKAQVITLNEAESITMEMVRVSDFSKLEVLQVKLNKVTHFQGYLVAYCPKFEVRFENKNTRFCKDNRQLIYKEMSRLEKLTTSSENIQIIEELMKPFDYLEFLISKLNVICNEF